MINTVHIINDLIEFTYDQDLKFAYFDITNMYSKNKSDAQFDEQIRVPNRNSRTKTTPKNTYAKTVLI
jgi:hypothetical protein